MADQTKDARAVSPLSLDVARLSKLSHRARVLAFIRVLLHAGHITRAQASLLKDITFEGCAFLEAAVELLCIDGNVDECGHTFRQVCLVEGGDTAASLPVIVEGGEDEGAEVEPSAGPKSSEKAASVDDTEAAVLVDFEHVDAATALSMLQSQPHSEQGFTRAEFVSAMKLFAPVSSKPAVAADDSAFAEAMGELFSAFDTDSNGIVDMQELGSGLSLFCRGTSDDKITAAFKLFDLDGNGVITKTEMQKYLTSVYCVIFQASPELSTELGVSAETLAQVTTDDAFQTADADQNGEISLAEFRAWFSTKSSEGMQSLLSAQAPGLQDDSDDTTDSDSTSSSSDAGSGEVTLTLAQFESITNVAGLDVEELMLLLRSCVDSSAKLNVDAMQKAFVMLLKPSHTTAEHASARDQFSAFGKCLFNRLTAHSRSGLLDPILLAASLSMLCAGSLSERLHKAMGLWDLGGDGYLQFDECQQYIRALLCATFLLSPAAPKRLGHDVDQLAEDVTTSVFVTGELDPESSFVGPTDLEGWSREECNRAFLEEIMCVGAAGDDE